MRLSTVTVASWTSLLSLYANCSGSRRQFVLDVSSLLISFSKDFITSDVRAMGLLENNCLNWKTGKQLPELENKASIKGPDVLFSDNVSGLRHTPEKIYHSHPWEVYTIKLHVIMFHLAWLILTRNSQK